MTQKSIERLIFFAKNFRGYDDRAKAEFHRLGKQYLKELARIMELHPDDYEIRSNTAGITCLGEVTLHSKNLYVQLGGSYASGRFFYRTVKGKQDYVGGPNAWMDYDNLLYQAGVAEQFTRYLDSHQYEWSS